MQRFLILLIWVNVSYDFSMLLGQELRLDSVDIKIKNEPVDSIKLDLIANVIKENLYQDATIAGQYADQYLIYANKIKNKRFIAKGTNFKGMVHYVKGEIPEALGLYINALKMFESLKDSLFLGMVTNNIGACYKFREEPKETIKYYEKALDIFKKINNKQWIANVSYNLVTQQIAQKEFANAEKNALISLNTFRALGDKNGEGLSQTLLGSIYLDQKKYHLAIERYHLSNKLITTKDDPQAVAINHENLGTCYYELGILDKAEENLLIAEKLLRKSESLEHLAKTLDILKKLYAKGGKFEKAFQYGEAVQVAKDSLFNIGKDQRMLDILKKYDLEKKENEIALLNSQNQIKDLKITKSEQESKLYILTIAGLILLSLLGFYLYRLKRNSSISLKENNKVISKALEEKEILMQEIHHRVKNNLQVVSSLLNLQSRQLTDAKAIEAIKVSQDRVKTMSLIHQSLYQDQDFKSVKLNMYLDNLTKSLFSSYNVHDQHIQLHANFEELNLDIDRVVPVGLIINELVTNALKYAFPEVKSGNVFVSAYKAHNELVIQVKDDGIGLPEDFIIDNTKSMGYQLVKNFVTKLAGNLTVTRLHEGSCIEIRIPEK